MADYLKKIPEAYEVIRTEYIDDIKSEAGLLRHRKTGARLVVLANDDENKTFSIGFKTPPKDSTGVAHIMEHSVLCGSEHFPAKDPFVELAKGSLNTFLNAMTYPDKTVYPIASCNDADFQNLMHVYLDAVFHPNIYLHREIFLQEGWHYELADLDSPLIYNGVVYNEMKGAFSSPEQILYRKITDTLFPDTIYSVESGGDPDVIPNLTYEQFLDFHRRYYHPSNSYIYLYGNMDVYEKLDFIDQEYLRHYDSQQVDSAIDRQKPFEKMVFDQGEYPVGDEEELSNSAYMACNWVVGNSLDPMLYLGFQILEYALLEAPGAPLKEALLKLNLAEDIYGIYETSLLQPYLSIIIKNMDEGRKDEILAVIQEELKRLAGGGLNHRTLEGALNFYEFRSREGDFGRWPKGLMYGLQLIDSWLYDDDKPFIHLHFQQVYQMLREGLEQGYFEKLIQTYLIDNTHGSVYLLLPSRGLAARREQALEKQLQAHKDSLSEEELKALVEETAHLKAYQSEPSPKEVLEMIPLLTIDDIKKEAEPLYNKALDIDGVPAVHHDIPTNGIGYLIMLFDVSHIPAEEVPYLGILTEALGNMNTKRYSYQELTDEVNLHTGGLRTAVNVYNVHDCHVYRPFFEIGGKALYGKMEKVFELFEEILMHTDFEDDRRLKDILFQMKSRLEMGFMSNGHSTAVNRATSYFNQGAWFKELVEGIAFYRFICGILKNYEAEKAGLIEKLKAICGRIFRKERLLADVTADGEGLALCRESIGHFADSLYQEKLPEGWDKPVSVGLCPRHNEAFITAGMVQYNACAGNFSQQGIDYDGAMNVLKNILSNEYLWNNIRVKGGAYGCMCGFTPSGNGFFTSYRDPNLGETYNIYHEAADYVSKLVLDERERTKYIIGAVGAVDTPMTASMKGARSLSAYLGGRSYEDIQKSRNELLKADEKTLRRLAKAVAAVADSGHICVVGSESRINAEKDRFEHVEQLIQ